MNNQETTTLCRYVRALCPQQKFDEYTPDAWHDLLGEYRLEDARAAAARVAKQQPFVSPSEIIDAIKAGRAENVRDIQGPGQPAAIPDADPDDVPAYLAAVRAQRTRAADGFELKSRPVKELLSGIGQKVPDEGEPRGPMSVLCPHCGSPPLRACKRGAGARMTGFHPSRIAAGRGDMSNDSDEVQRRAASAAALEQLTPQQRDQLSDFRNQLTTAEEPS